ncbi:hypothetical protein MNBD_GAMMA11-1855 [hydrothermal vent metagenome]|uniref:Uncharacterized protein n=1 Tax=hydrothermal vent metagenome TaxID=652676 RepID=A0A3B0WXG8_9ZZZZ
MTESGKQIESALKKSNIEIKTEQLARASTSLAQERSSFDNDVKALTDLQQNNTRVGKMLNKEGVRINKRGPLAKGALGAISIVTGSSILAAEEQNIRKITDALENDKLEAKRLQKAIVKRHPDLLDRELNFNNAQRRYLNAERDALKEAYKEEKKAAEKQIEALNNFNRKNERLGLSTAATDQLIAQINSEIKALEETIEANEAARWDNRNNKRSPPNQAIMPCPKKCEASTLEVSCKHFGKTRKAKLPPGTSVAELHVISASLASDPAFVDILYVSIEGGCGEGKTTVSPSISIPELMQRDEEGYNCPYAVVTGTDTNVRLPGTAGSPLEIAAYSPSVDMRFRKLRWADFIKHVFTPREDKVSTYTVEAKGCGGEYDGLAAQIHAHTKVQWGGEIAFSWEKLAPESNEAEEDGTALVETDTAVRKWALEGKVAGSHDGTKFDLGTKLNDEFFPGLRKTIGGVASFLNRLDDIENSNADADQPAAEKDGATKPPKIFKFSVNYPKVVIGGSYENKEHPEDYTVDNEFKVFLKLDPLIGAKIEIDILRALLNIASDAIAPGAYSQAKKFASYMKKITRH